MTPITLDSLCNQIHGWSLLNFGDDDPHWRVYGMMEEIGRELLAHVDIPRGELIYDDLADVLIFACDAIGRWGFKLSECIEKANEDAPVPRNRMGATALALEIMRCLGLLSYTILKEHQGIRDGLNPEYLRAARMASLGTIWILIDHYTSSVYDQPALVVVNKVFSEIVEKRNWTENSVNGTV